jgi:hypothetical protein
MLKVIGKALAGMVLTKEARQAAGDLAQAALKNALKKPTEGAPEATPDLSVPAAPALSGRAELIRQAMQVRAAKQSVLAELDEKDRAKLMETAMRAFLNESKSKE